MDISSFTGTFNNGHQVCLQSILLQYSANIQIDGSFPMIETVLELISYWNFTFQ